MIPDLAVLLAFSAASVVLIMTPGPDMTLFLSQTLIGGRRLGVASMLGATTGCFIHIGLAVFGLSALLAASPAAFGALKIVGAGYLLWLAFNALRHGSALTVDRSGARLRSFREIYLIGIGVNLLNPKVVLFFLTFFPQFVTVGDGNAQAKLLVLGLVFQALSIVFGVALILTAERFTATLKRSRRAMRTFDWLFAGVMGAFALKLLAAQR